MERHVILTLGRSGSNTLSDMLNQNPEVLNFGEVLGPWTQTRRMQRRLPFRAGSDTAFLDRILYSEHFPRTANLIRSAGKLRRGERAAMKRYRDIRTIGIKEFSLNFQRYGLTDYLASHPDIKVIGLVRENVVDRLVSNLALGQTGVVSTRSDADAGTADRKLHVDPAETARMLDVIEDENQLLRAMLDRVPEASRMVIRYEDLFHDEAARDRAVREVFAFLGVRDVATRARMKKIVRTPVSDLIANFDACLAAVRGTRHEALLRAAADRG